MFHYRINKNHGIVPVYDFEAENDQEAFGKAVAFLENTRKFNKKSECSLWKDQEPNSISKTWEIVCNWETFPSHDKEDWERRSTLDSIRSQFDNLEQKIVDLEERLEDR